MTATEPTIDSPVLVTASDTTPAAPAVWQDRLDDLRRKAPLRDLLPLEAAAGIAIPVRRGDKLLAFVPFMLHRRRPGGGVSLSPVIASVLIDYRTGRVVEFVDHTKRDSADARAEAGVFPHESLRGVPAGVYLERRTELTAGLSELMRLLSAREPLPTPLCERVAELFTQLVPPAALPAYRAAAPKFVERFVRTAP
jgi:hypothetical protein